MHILTVWNGTLAATIIHHMAGFLCPTQTKLYLKKGARKKLKTEQKNITKRADFGEPPLRELSGALHCEAYNQVAVK